MSIKPKSYNEILKSMMDPLLENADLRHKENMRKFLKNLDLLPSESVLDTLLKALQVQQPYIGVPLQIESLEDTLKSITFDDKHLKP